MAENQDQRPGESVSSIDKIADLILGNDGQSDDVNQQDTRNDESQTDVSAVGNEDVIDQAQDDVQDEQGDSDITWSKALGVSDDDIALDEEGNFVGVKVVVNGKDELVPLTELKNGYQFSKANTQKAQAIAEERKQLEEVKAVVTGEYTKKLTNVAKLSELLAAKFLEDYNSIDWNRLRLEQPGEYAALQRDYDLKRSELQTVFTAIESEQTNVAQQQSGEVKQKINAHLAAQAELVINNNPDWRDVNKFKTAMSDIAKFVGDAYGFTPNEFSSVYDARLIELIKDAKAYRDGKTNIESKTKTKVPIFQKSSGQAKKTSRLDQLVKTAKNAKGSARRVAETDAITALLLGQ